MLNLKQQLRAYEQEVKDFEAVVEAATQSYNQANRLLKVRRINTGDVPLADYFALHSNTTGPRCSAPSRI